MADFDTTRLDASYSDLGALPDVLLDIVMSSHHGTLDEVVSAALCWRGALVEGRLPAEHEVVKWPDEATARALRDRLERLDIARYCKGRVEQTDRLVASILENLEWIEDRALEELLELERSREEQEHTFNEDRQESDNPEQLLEAPDLTSIAREHALDEGLSRFESVWQPRADAWQKLMRLLGDVSSLLGRGWDWALGALGSSAWIDFERLTELVERAPEWRDLIAEMGRLRETDEEDISLSDAVFGAITRPRLIEQRTLVEDVPMETRGITHSNHLARQLPTEMLAMSHALLKKPWYARWVDHALMTYRVIGEEIEWFESDVEEHDACPERGKKRERGPIMVCVDTSGSMSGTPEQVAKALTLEAARVAASQQRRCYLYLFSGPGQVREHDVSLDGDNFMGLLDFLRLSFHGGTDVVGPLEKALERLEQDDWSRADILLLSDGYFPENNALADKIERSREEKNLEVHGVMIGASRSDAMARYCDHLHRFTRWTSLAVG